MKRIIALLLAAVTLMFIITGCGTKQTSLDSETSSEVSDIVDTGQETEVDKETEEEPAEPEFRTVTDIQGRTVEVPYTVDEVAALGSAGRMLTYAGCADKIVGCNDLEKEGQSGMPYAYINKEHFAACTSVASGGSGDTVYAEELAVLAPDVIFYFGADKDTLDQMQAQMGVPVIGLYASNFYDEDLRQTLRLVGEIMGTSDHVEEVITALNGWIADLNDRTKDIPDEDKPTVYTGALGFRGAHGFDGTSANFPPFLAVNANNVVDETGEAGTFLVDLEKVAVWDPDYIFLNPGSMNLVNEDYAVNAAFYDNLSAVKNNQVYSLVSYNYNYTNQELAIVDAYYVGCIIYPEEFEDVDFEVKAEEIFNVMLGCDYLEVLKANDSGFGTITIGE